MSRALEGVSKFPSATSAFNNANAPLRRRGRKCVPLVAVGRCTSFTGMQYVGGPHVLRRQRVLWTLDHGPSFASNAGAPTTDYMGECSGGLWP